jgi:alkylation response protein AidB-like acyl-CoA dehydrogenase
MTTAVPSLSRLSPAPAPLGLPNGYPRHEPSRSVLRAAINQLTSAQDWPALTWTDLVGGLLAVGRTDIPLSRLAEGHIDALRILEQAGVEPRPDQLYGVWASRSAGTGVAAVVEGDRLRLSGTIRFASGAGVIDRALVPVWPDESTHLLVDLATGALPVDRDQWQTSAMQVSQSHTVRVDEVVVPRADVVGAENFYLSRQAFLPGGVGVAAVWAGGLGRVLDVTVRMLQGRAVSPAQDLRLGRARLQLVAALTAVRAAGTRLDELLVGAMSRLPMDDEGAATRPDGDEIAAVSAEARAVVAGAVITALTEIRALAGPAGLAFDPDLGHALDDLGLYVAQLNGDAEATRAGAGLRDDQPRDDKLA